MMLRTITVASLAAFALTGCNSEDSDGSGLDDVELAGHWKVSGSSISYDMVVDDDNRFMAYNGSVLFAGPMANSINKTSSGIDGTGVFVSSQKKYHANLLD